MQCQPGSPSWGVCPCCIHGGGGSGVTWAAHIAHVVGEAGMPVCHRHGEIPLQCTQYRIQATCVGHTPMEEAQLPV